MKTPDQKPSAEIIIYQETDNDDFHIEVLVENETVWLTQAQMVELFSATKQNISLHIHNIFKEGELERESTVKEYLTVQQEGTRKVRRKITAYNLDVIISVGYRVKSKRGTQFRIWANKVLKEYLLKGYVVNHRLDLIENNVHELKKKVDDISFQIKTSLTPEHGIFYDGQIFDAWQFISGIIKSARSSVVLIDNYIDESVLFLLSKRELNVTATIYTVSITKSLQLDIQRFNKQYEKIEVKTFTKSHDRFLIIDKKQCITSEHL